MFPQRVAWLVDWRAISVMILHDFESKLMQQLMGYIEWWSI